MVPPTAKQKYDKLYAKLAEQHRTVKDGVTSPVSQKQLEELAQLQDACSTEFGGLAAPGSSVSAERMREIERREAAVLKREDEVKRKEIEYEQQEVVLEALKEEVEMWREKNDAEKAKNSA